MPFIIPSWALGAAVILIAIQIGRAISGRNPRFRRAFLQQSDTDVAEVAELRQSLEAMQHRVAELEERVDFTERLLAKQRDADRLGA
jgi:TolA-binding protein